MDFIDGDSFENMCDITYSNNLNNDLTHYYLNNSDLPVVYCCTDQIFELFVNIDQNFDIILVSHNSDNQIRNKDVLKKPDNIKFWYANNLIGSFENVYNIPTGLERDRWFSRLRKKETIINLNKLEKQVKKLAFVCFNSSRKWDVDRRKIIGLFSNKPWCNILHGRNGSGFYEYANGIYQHEFVFCPVGNQVGYTDGDNAVGSHRFWEILYLNSIPIVLNLDGNRSFNLPVCYVNKWEDVTEEFLNSELERIINTEYDLDILIFEYWKKLISEKKVKNESIYSR